MYRDILARPLLARYLCPPLRVRQHRPSPEARTARVSAARCPLSRIQFSPGLARVWCGSGSDRAQARSTTLKLEYGAACLSEPNVST